MAWTKDLGNIKGDKGDIYIPNITTNKNTGYTTIEWTKAPHNDEMDNNVQKINVPVYVPNYNEQTGDLTFELNMDGTFTDISNETYHIKGETGATGTSTFAIQPFTGDINDTPTEDRHNNAFYVETTANGVTPKVYIYDKDNDKFISLEGFNFDNYYLKTETYSARDIDSMFTNITNQQKNIQQLLDIEETIESNNQSGE